MARNVIITERELLALREAATALKDPTESVLRVTESAKRTEKALTRNKMQVDLFTKSRKKFNA